MPQLLYQRNAAGIIGVSIRLDNREKVWLLFSKHGCVVRKQGLIFKPRLYSETNLDTVIEMVEALDARYPHKIAPQVFKNHPLSVILNAIWHCKSTAEVRAALSRPN